MLAQNAPQGTFWSAKSANSAQITARNANSARIRPKQSAQPAATSITLTPIRLNVLTA